MSRYVIAAALPPVIVYCLQAVLNRLFRAKSPQVLIIVSMVAGYALFFPLIRPLFPAAERDSYFYAYMFFLYSFSAYSYFHVFNMSETARRIRMINAIGSENRHSAAELVGVYDENAMIRARIDRLIALGQIKEEAGLFYPTGRLFPTAARVVYALSRLFARPWPPMLKFERSRLRG